MSTTLRGQSATLRTILMRFGLGLYSNDIRRVGVTAIITFCGKPRAALGLRLARPRMPTARTGCPGVAVCTANLHISNNSSTDVVMPTPTVLARSDGAPSPRNHDRVAVTQMLLRTSRQESLDRPVGTHRRAACGRRRRADGRHRGIERFQKDLDLAVVYRVDGEVQRLRGPLLVDIPTAAPQLVGDGED